MSISMCLLGAGNVTCSLMTNIQFCAVKYWFLLLLLETVVFSLFCPEGIPPHVDTHSAFEDGIVSLSLGSQVFIS